MTTAAPHVIAAAQHMADQLAQITAAQGQAVELSGAMLLDRSDSLDLKEAGRVSPNGSCRILRAADGWVAVNLPRKDDLDLLPAWIGCDFDEPAWPALERTAARESAATFAGRGAELGLAVSLLGECTATSPHPPLIRPPGAAPALSKQRLNVLDLSALWAGPLCGAMLAEAGHDVIKAESPLRPDPVATHTPALDRRLNGGKARRQVGFPSPELDALLAQADVLITSARPRAFEAMGMTPARLFSHRPALIWIAITGHGWQGEGAMRIGFGDDAAVAGGLVCWREGEPCFAGDAVADPLTGLAAAIAAIELARQGGGAIVDAALARTAAGVMAAP